MVKKDIRPKDNCPYINKSYLNIFNLTLLRLLGINYLAVYTDTLWKDSRCNSTVNDDFSYIRYLQIPFPHAFRVIILEVILIAA